MSQLDNTLNHQRNVMDNIQKSFGSGFDMNEELEKARHGVYADNATNRKLNRVGQEYGNAAKEKEKSPNVKSGSQDDGGYQKMAKEASDKALKRASEDENADPKVREMAKKELDNRGGNEDKNKGNNLDYKNIILHRMDVPINKIPAKEYKFIQKFIQDHDPDVNFRSLEDEDDFDDKMLVYMKSIISSNLFNRGFSESFKRKLVGWNNAVNDAIRDRIVKNQDKYEGDSKKFTFKNGKIQRV